MLTDTKGKTNLVNLEGMAVIEVQGSRVVAEPLREFYRKMLEPGVAFVLKECETESEANEFLKVISKAIGEGVKLFTITPEIESDKKPCDYECKNVRVDFVETVNEMLDRIDALERNSR